MTRQPGPTFILPRPEPDDTRPRNVWGILKGFGQAYAEYYRKQDARERYALIFHSEEPPRFPGDTVCGSTRYQLTMDSKPVASIHHSLMYHRDRLTYTVALNPIRWEGKRTDDHFDHDWHDAGPFETIEEAKAVAVDRCEAIRLWRAENP